MKNILFKTLLICSIFLLPSCMDSDTGDSYLTWKEDNESFFQQMEDSIDATTGKLYYTKLYSEAYPSQYLLYRALVTSDNTDTINANSTVYVNYNGRLYNTEDFFDEGNDVKFRVDQLIEGWSLALQNMHKGDKWELIIPWELGYGMSGSAPSILPYSTLIFDVDVLDVDYEIGTNPEK